MIDGVGLVRRKELLQLSEERRGRGVVDPTELWRQWYETGARMWSGVFRAGLERNNMDPFGLYRQWFNGWQSLQKRMFEPVMGRAARDGSAVSVVSPAAQMNPAAASKPVADISAGQAAEGQNRWKRWVEAAA